MTQRDYVAFDLGERLWQIAAQNRHLAELVTDPALKQRLHDMASRFEALADAEERRTNFVRRALGEEG
jgi:hypothetical protein